ncbi:hypothetical protein SEVIR_5G336900v4 [Setaria viridis]|uniref:NAC domain-containing protein n=3 Tax=Setaria TaxID=4554 RepID=A0A368RBI3_SETIT|nr:NAC transcription factor 47 [Setaria italica]RCV27539.1 hypothetical protein SETIT_5G332800v2 [Setaria italica]TKW17002.1 hypothetical protein SEVIR_5G336900v2 [Setaria viridis]
MEAAAASTASKLGLPPGFRFVPTDEEVVVHYLLRRIQNQPLPVGDILDDDPLSAPPWLLLAKHGRKGDAFFFAEGQAMKGKGSRQKRSCAGGGTWEGQGQRKAAKGREGEKLRVRVDGEEIEWRKYALNFQGEVIKGSTGWVMHEYSITAPPELAASPVRVYRIRFSGHGKNAQKRKRNEIDWASDEEEEVYQGAARAAARPAVAEPDALFVGGCPSAPQPEPVSYLPVPVVAGSDALFVGGCPSAPQLGPVSYLPMAPVYVGNGNLAEWTGTGAGGALSAATSSLAQDLPALVDGGGEDWNFIFSSDDLLPGFEFSGAADAGAMSAPMVPAA